MFSNYRVMQATSGSYYVQKYSSQTGWKKVGSFYESKLGARNYAKRLKNGDYPRHVVVEYV